MLHVQSRISLADNSFHLCRLEKWHGSCLMTMTNLHELAGLLLHTHGGLAEVV